MKILKTEQIYKKHTETKKLYNEASIEKFWKLIIFNISKY